MRLLIWQWGRFGAGPRVAAELARACRALPDVQVVLSLAEGAEIMQGPAPPCCELPWRTYAGIASFSARLLAMPLLVPKLARRIETLGISAALCAMPGPLDLAMGAALHRAGRRFALMVHDADPHPGDGFPLQMQLQRRLIGQSDALVALSAHVAARLRQTGAAANKPLLRSGLPPFVFAATPPPPPGAHAGPFRLLSFGRLLPYKGLDLLADSLDALGPRAGLVVRVVGQGPGSAALTRLAAMPNVTVENRWVPEIEVADLLGWADGLVLSHREASQSGVAAAAVAAGRRVVATRVGGLAEQLGDEPLATLCEPDAAAIAAAIASMAETPHRNEARGDLWAGWQQMAATLVADLARVLG